jgi:uncharacterized membrane protein YfcA
MHYYITASVISNTVWFLTFKKLILEDMNYVFLIPYVIGTTIGSVIGMKISMKIEKWLGATADGHINKK